MRSRPSPVVVAPAAPEVEVASETPVAPPRLKPSMDGQSTPHFLNQPPHVLPQPSMLQALVEEAEEHFREGKLNLLAGEAEAAREKFNLAIDTLLSAPEELLERSDVDDKIAEMVEEIHRFDVAGLGAGEMEEQDFDRAALDEIPELTFPVDPKQRRQVQDELRATVSQLPLEVNDEVLRYINFFSTGRGRTTLLRGLERAGRYRHLIQRILDEEGVPQELIHLAQAESAFLPRAVSRKRASGMWQFMLFRGREYGLLRTVHYDDRFDPEKATRAAAQHLRDLYTRYGDWYLAMAAYNCGPGNVDRAIQRTGYADFWELRRRNVLPGETANYVPIILAMIIMAKNPADYGLADIQTNAPLEYSTVEIRAATPLSLIADITGSTLAEIRELNPALLRTTVPAGYTVHVPRGTAATVVAALDMIPPSRRATWRVHLVGEGETLAMIARRYRASVRGISEANYLNGDGPEAGNLLLIPAAPTPAAKRRSGG